MYIGENIKRLRRERDVTQEKLAEHLNISCQAISKWERSETYPDITLVMPIAAYFRVTTDELLGINHVKNEARIIEHIAEYDRLSNLGKDKEKCDYIRAAYKEFPNDWRIIEKYMWMLLYDPHIERFDDFPGFPTHINELERLCNRILDKCSKIDLRLSATGILIDICKHRGDDEKARAMMEHFPASYGNVRSEVYEVAYRNKVKLWHEESESRSKWHLQMRKNIDEYVTTLIVKFRNCVMSSSLLYQERINQYSKVVDFIKFIHEDGDYGFRHYPLSEIYDMITRDYIRLENYEKAAEYLELTFSHAKQYDELPDVTPFTSFWLRGHQFVRCEIYGGYECNEVMNLIKMPEKYEVYRKASEFDWYKEVADKYRAYASENKVLE